MEIKQKEVWLVKMHPNLGKIKKYRPCLVVQNDKMNSLMDTIIIVPFSSAVPEKPSIYEVKLSCIFFDKESVALAYGLQSIKKFRFVKKLGLLEDEDYFIVSKAIANLINQTN